VFCLHLSALFRRKEAVNTVLDAIKFYILCFFSQTSEGHKLLRNCVSPGSFVLWDECWIICTANVFIRITSVSNWRFYSFSSVSSQEQKGSSCSVISHKVCSRRLPFETCTCAYCSGKHCQFTMVYISLGYVRRSGQRSLLKVLILLVLIQIHCLFILLLFKEEVWFYFSAVLTTGWFKLYSHSWSRDLTEKT